MKDKDIEKLLQESADKIKLKDFSERWPIILKRINEIEQHEVSEELRVDLTSKNPK